MLRLLTFTTGILSLAFNASHVHCQDIAAEMTRLVEALEFNPISFQLHGQRMLEHGIRTGDCDSLCISEFLLRNAAFEYGGIFDSSTINSWAQCDCKASPLSQTRGYEAFSAGLNDEAIQHFQEAIEWAESKSDSDLRLALQSLGAVYMKEFEYGKALNAFERAYLVAPESQNPTEINNLAFASFIAGDCDFALEFTSLGLEKLDQLMLDRPEVLHFFKGEQNVLRLTQLQVLLDLGLSDAADQTFNAIRIENGFNGREAVALSILTLYTQQRNNLGLFKALLPTFERIIQDNDITDWPALLGANARLFQPYRGDTPLEDAWSASLQIPAPFRGYRLETGMCRNASAMEAAETSNSKQTLLFFIAALALLLFTVLIYVLRLAISDSALRKMTEESTPIWISLVNEALDPSEPMTAEKQKRAMVAFNLIKRNELVAHLPGSEAWTELELEVAKGLWAGEHSKSMAARLNISVSTLYKVRSRLRQRLQTPPEASISDWIRKHSRLKAIFLLVGLRLLLSDPLSAQNLGLGSLKSTIKNGNFEAWKQHIQSVQSSPNFEEILDGIPPPFHWAYLPENERPVWAQVPDSTLWVWHLSGLSGLMLWTVQTEGLNIVPFDPNPMAALLEGRRTATLQRILWGLTVGLLGLLILAWRCRKAHLRRLQPHESYENQPIWEALATAQVSPEARTAWKSFLSERSMQHHDSGLWALLTNSEKEVAMRLAEGIAAGAIAKTMACSESYIYNIRSTIRRKWELKPDEDLVEAIRQIYDRDGIQF